MITNLDPIVANNDFEFVGFSFNGHHSDEYDLVVVASSGMTQQSLFADFQDTTLQVSGKDGSYYFGTNITEKRLPVSLAFDNMTGDKKRNILSWLNPKTIGKLVFDESPYKYYYVKVAAPPSFSFVPFEEDITNGKKHIFKGTIDLEFAALDPYSYCDYALISDIAIWNGATMAISNPAFGPTNLPGWSKESGLFESAPTNSPYLAFTNANIGFINPNTITAGTNCTNAAGSPVNFYNTGNIESLIEFSTTVNYFNNASTFQFKNMTNNPVDILEIKSLNGIPALANQASGTWTINCKPSLGLITATSSTTGSTVYNLGSLHNGIFLKAYPGNNILQSNKSIINTTIKYKHKYW